jgi:Photosynthesis system II assembly factor YCF48
VRQLDEVNVNNFKTDRESSIDKLLGDALLARAASNATDRCLDAETLAAWADQTLTSPERAAAEAHAADCARCQAMLAAMAHTMPAPSAAPWWRVHLFGWLVPVGAAAAALVVWSILPGRSVRDGNTALHPTANVARPEQPALTAHAEAAQPAPAIRPLPATVHEQDRTRTARGTAAAAKRESSPPASKADVAEQVWTRLVGEPAGAAPPPPAPAATPAPQPSSAPAVAGAVPERPAPERSADAAASLTERAALASARAAVTRQGAADRIMAARARAAAPITVITSTNALTRWRIVPDGAVERSTDGGSTWLQQQTGAQTKLTAGASPSPSVCWLVGSRGIILLSTDGSTWKHVAFPDPIDLVSVRATDDKTATVTAADGRSFETTDGGTTWKPR